METIKLDLKNIESFVGNQEIEALQQEVNASIGQLLNATGRGNDFLGWVELPVKIEEETIVKINTLAEKVAPKIDTLIVVGIGGSYLGAKAVFDALANPFTGRIKPGGPRMIFAGHQISEDYMYQLTEMLDTTSYAIVVISKSGTTTEPALAFRLLKQHLMNKEGAKEANSRIIAVTDGSKGALRMLADEEGYESYVIPDDVGGRYSVLTPVGLVPLAICGVDIGAFVDGFRSMYQQLTTSTLIQENIAARYAAARSALYRKGKKIEIMVNYHHGLHFVAEWWKQLYGESEGKENRGLFPAAVDNSSDLHSLGQYIQEGERILFETVLSVARTQFEVRVPTDDKNLDKLNYLSGKRIDHVNKMAELGTTLAHVDGDVPNLRIEIPELNAYYIGQLLYFFEFACGISGYMLDVNPFDQPGVEAYKKNMFALLEKPGFEAETEKIRKRI